MVHRGDREGVVICIQQRTEPNTTGNKLVDSSFNI